MRRRRFMQAIVAAPAVPALVAQQTATPAAPATPQGRGGRGGPGGGRGAQEVAKLELTPPDTVSEPTPRFFTAAQFAALRKLSDAIQPPLKGAPGALDCGVPEFLDFLIGASPADKQTLYRTGLDSLNASARKQFSKAFADLDAGQIHTILEPHLVAVPWVYDPPKDPMKHFIFDVREDVQTATRNSRQYATAAAASGRRGGGFGGGGSVWLPIDPIYKG